MMFPSDPPTQRALLDEFADWFSRRWMEDARRPGMSEPRIGGCTCDPASRGPDCPPFAPDDERALIFRDIGDILRALGLGDHARPYSAHEVVQRDILPAIARTSTATADDRCPTCGPGYRYGDDGCSHKPLTRAATADTGLRERVEALLADEWRDEPPSPTYPEGRRLYRWPGDLRDALRAALDATAAPTTDTEAHK